MPQQLFDPRVQQFVDRVMRGTGGVADSTAKYAEDRRKRVGTMRRASEDAQHLMSQGLISGYSANDETGLKLNYDYSQPLQNTDLSKDAKREGTMTQTINGVSSVTDQDGVSTNSDGLYDATIGALKDTAPKPTITDGKLDTTPTEVPETEDKPLTQKEIRENQKIGAEKLFGVDVGENEPVEGVTPPADIPDDKLDKAERALENGEEVDEDGNIISKEESSPPANETEAEKTARINRENHQKMMEDNPGFDMNTSITSSRGVQKQVSESQSRSTAYGSVKPETVVNTTNQAEFKDAMADPAYAEAERRRRVGSFMSGVRESMGYGGMSALENEANQHLAMKGEQYKQLNESLKADADRATMEFKGLEAQGGSTAESKNRTEMVNDQNTDKTTTGTSLQGKVKDPDAGLGDYVDHAHPDRNLPVTIGEGGSATWNANDSGSLGGFDTRAQAEQFAKEQEAAGFERTEILEVGGRIMVTLYNGDKPVPLNASFREQAKRSKTRLAEGTNQANATVEIQQQNLANAAMVAGIDVSKAEASDITDANQARRIAQGATGAQLRMMKPEAFEKVRPYLTSQQIAEYNNGG